MMIEEYVEQYISALTTYETLDDVDGKLLAKYDPSYINGQELEVKLIDAITNHFKAKKADIKKLLEMEEI